MRLLATAVLGFVFVAVFVVFFLLSSVVGFVDSPDRLVESAQSQGLRDEVVELTAGYIAAEVAADPSLKTMAEEELRGIVGTVISEDWLTESLRSAHAALKSAVHGAEDTAVLDFRATKEALRGALSKLKDRAAIRNCAELLGAEACADADTSRDMIENFEFRATRAIDKITDEIDLLGELEGQDREQATRLQEGLESMETVKMLTLVVLIMSLALIIALNARPLRRLLLVTGALAMVSSLIYLVVVAVSDGVASDQLEVRAGPMGQGAVQDFSAKLITKLVGDSLTGSTMPVSLIGVMGFVALMMVLVLGRRTS